MSNLDDPQQRDLLLAAQRMEAIGRLAGGVAHDFNNALTVIRGQAEVLLDDAALTEDHRGAVETILKAAEHAAMVTRQLLAFSRQQVLQPQVLSLNRVVRDLENVLQRVIGEDIEVRTEFDAELDHTAADRRQVEQVLLNLAVNARNAMPSGGVLRIATDNAVIDKTFAARFPYHVQPGAYVRISVSDNGKGIDRHAQEHIFEPFFKTEGEQMGGLMLSTVYGIVKQSGGYIWVDSEPGRGTTFRIYFPRSEGEVEEVKPLPLLGSDGSETILLVEDNPDVRTLLRNVLLKRGYSVLEAENGREALEVVDNYPRPVDLLVTDIVMPEMNGREIAKLIAEKQPGVRVLLISGYTEEAAQRPGILEPGTPFLEKPFSMEAFTNKVREILSR